jgi:DNA invertase Pin-like site-specific DNA recombinase
MRVALYLRRSTVDLQPDSLTAQEALLRSYAAAHAQEVVRVYADSASGRSIERRDEFQRLIAKVEAGADFEGVLVRDVSRWSRAENTDEAGFYEFICRRAGVEVIYVDESFAPDCSPYSLLLKSVKRAMAAEFSREKARVVQESHARLVRQGFWPTGSVPYALKRVLVDESGRELKSLEPGDRKALANQRVKLAPGEPRHVEVVRRIFGKYLAGASVNSIAEALTAEGVPSSKGRLWTSGMVAYVLQNEAYNGSLVYWIRGGAKPSELLNLRDSDSDRLIRCENAHPAIVDPATWNAVQQKLRASSHRKTDRMLLEELASARKRWRIGRRTAKEVVTGSELRRGYGKPDLELIGQERIAEAAELISEAIGREMHVTSFEGGILIDHLLHIGFAVSLPHARFGGLHWKFAFSGTETEDVVLGLAFSPPPSIEHVETFFFRTSQFRRRPHSVLPPLDPERKTQRWSRFPADEPPLDLLRYAIRFRGKRAEERLLASLRGRSSVSLEAVAGELGWPVTSTRTLYRKLDLRGEILPPLKNGRTLKRLTVTCPHCLRTRSLTPAIVLSLKTDVCFECLHRPPVITPNRLVAECPECGARRLLRPSEVATRSRGLQTPCRQCSMARGRAAGRAHSANRGRS